MSARRRLTVLVAAILGLPAGSMAGALDARLLARLRSAHRAETIAVIAYLPPCADLPTEPARAIAALRSRAHASQGGLLRALAGMPHGRVRPLWVVNAVAFSAPPRVIRVIAARSDVQRVTEDRLHISGVPRGGPDARRGVSVPWNIALVRADALWAEGTTGAGVTVGIIDTGVDAAHPDLAGRMAAGGWFDAVGGGSTPYDDQGHGTRVTGIVCGGAASGTAIGVAPGARFMAAKALDSQGRFQDSWVLAAGQWMADPNGDGNPSDAPAIVNCSWTYDIRNDDGFHEVLQLWRSEGIWPVFAAGNAGPGAGSAGSPGTDPLAICVGATNSTDGIADFSGRGPAPPPAPFDEAPKPDISAPGVLIRSSVPGGGYGTASGTSMASPHVAGALALLRQALPQAGFDDALKRIALTSIDLGAPGADAAYGSGRLDAWAAVHIAGGYVPPAITGTVRDATGHPVADAVVDVAGTRTVAGLDGAFAIPHAAAGTYSATADAPGAASLTTAVVTGTPAGHTLSARAEASFRDGMESGPGWTPMGPPGGTARVSDVNRTPGGTWSLTVQATGDGLERYFLSSRVPVQTGGAGRVNSTYAWRAAGNSDGRTTALVWEDAYGKTVGIDYGTPYEPPTRGGPADGVWRAVLMAYHAAAPAGASWVRLRLGAVFAGGDTSSAIWYDDAALDIVGGPPLPVRGDADGDGMVSPVDAALALRMAGGLATSGGLARADIAPPGGDAAVSLNDAAAIMRLAAGL